MSRRLTFRLGMPLVLVLLGLGAAAAGAVSQTTDPGAQASPAATAESPPALNAAPTEGAMPYTAQAEVPSEQAAPAAHGQQADFMSMLFVFLLSSFIGLGVIRRVSRLLHTPLMSLTNAISAIAVVGSILVVGPAYPDKIRILGSIALFASMTNIVSGFLITDRMLKMFKTDKRQAIEGGKQ